MTDGSNLRSRVQTSLVVLGFGVLAFWYVFPWGVAVFSLMCAMCFEVLASLRKTAEPNPRGELLALVLALVIISGCTAMVYLRGKPVGAFLIVLNVMMVAASDIGAYAVGKKFGKHRLWYFYQISPNKTNEGFIGGMIVGYIAGVITWLTGSTFAEMPDRSGRILVLFLSTPVVATAGDLFASKVKRVLGVKDFSNYLRGHGGFIDRFDSHILVFATIGWTQYALFR